MITPSLKAEILSDRFDERFAEINREIAGAMERAGEAGLEEANRRAKVKTGYLRSRNQFLRWALHHYELVNDAPYAPHLNFGTRAIRADHFFDIAAQVMIRAFMREVKAIVII